MEIGQRTASPEVEAPSATSSQAGIDVDGFPKGADIRAKFLVRRTVLCALADKVEKGVFKDGFHPATDNVGKPIGSIYVDYSEGDELI
ncbi:hypothetical protein [Neorhizobium sp. JUb45]|uniref:hypothetical protein n=1 Tax=Neorhizobium sp. JUb45 TaxID=2485113 RepID=UPI0010E22B4F|nr:hypothetical protein [Neorhizobium sp. JUb45]TCR07357.1 hypothetical protein EDF70_1011331 [Neorhizobium sp. JUb45]